MAVEREGEFARVTMNVPSDDPQSIPQPVRVHELATAAGCQLVATAGLAVASEEAGFAIPGGQGPRDGLHRDVFDARTALEWGLVNPVVPAAELDVGCLELLPMATRGSRRSKAMGKQGFYVQVDHDQAAAYAYAIELMPATSQTPDSRERMAAFFEKRAPRFD